MKRNDFIFVIKWVMIFVIAYTLIATLIYLTR